MRGARVLRLAIDGPDRAGKTYTIKKIIKELNDHSVLSGKMGRPFRVTTLSWPSQTFRKGELWKTVPERLEKGVSLEDIEYWGKAIVEDMLSGVEGKLREITGVSDNLVIIEDRSILSTVVYQYAMYLYSEAKRRGSPLSDRELGAVSTEKNFIRWFYWVQAYHNSIMENMRTGDIDLGSGTLIVLGQSLADSFVKSVTPRNETPTDTAFEEMAPVVFKLFDMSTKVLLKAPEQFFTGLCDVQHINGNEDESKQNADFATLTAVAIALSRVSVWARDITN